MGNMMDFQTLFQTSLRPREPRQMGIVTPPPSSGGEKFRAPTLPSLQFRVNKLWLKTVARSQHEGNPGRRRSRKDASQSIQRVPGSSRNPQFTLILPSVMFAGRHAAFRRHPRPNNQYPIPVIRFIIVISSHP